MSTTMKGYDEIKDIIVNRLDLRDQATYKAYIDQFHRWHSPRVPTDEEIELLSPDAIDNHAFWRVAEDVFGTDPVSNCGYTTPVTREQANRRNLSIYHCYGFTGFIEATVINGFWPEARVLEIGPGYGAFHDWLGRAAPAFRYYGADCYPKIDCVDQTLPTGRLAEVTKARTYDLVVSSNVFQHLSVAQRRDYYRDVAGCLSVGGRFMVSMLVDVPDRISSNHRDAKGRNWCKHYGQFTEIQTQDAILEDIRQHFTVESVLVDSGRSIVVRGIRRRLDPKVSLSLPMEERT